MSSNGRNRENRNGSRRDEAHEFMMFGDVDRSEKLGLNPRRAKKKLRDRNRPKDHERTW